MKQNLFQKDGTYGRLGFLLSNDGDLIPFGYRDIYDVVLNVGYENIDYTYHNSALCEEYDYGPDLIYSPMFPQKQILTTLARDYQMTAFKMVNAPYTGEKRDFLVIAAALTKEAYEVLQMLNQTGIFRQLQLCRWMHTDGTYTDYETMNEFLTDYQSRKRK